MAYTHTLIESYTVGSSGAASITFGSGNTIPQTYKDLVIKMVHRNTNSATVDGLVIEVNGSTANVTTKYIDFDGAGLRNNSTAGNFCGYYQGTQFSTNGFTISEIYMPNYTFANTKNWQIQSTANNNVSAGSASYYTGTMNQTRTTTSSPITQIRLAGGDNFAQYSSFYLYGIV
jgi:hypothetical protein